MQSSTTGASINDASWTSGRVLLCPHPFRRAVSGFLGQPSTHTLDVFSC